ncbi:hypothetical protein J6590_002214 [Homalodisca vitripennis]|nr:hypothetical protein J6590_002214 [Homalodisca vitripennis]
MNPAPGRKQGGYCPRCLEAEYTLASHNASFILDIPTPVNALGSTKVLIISTEETFPLIFVLQLKTMSIILCESCALYRFRRHLLQVLQTKEKRDSRNKFKNITNARGILRGNMTSSGQARWGDELANVIMRETPNPNGTVFEARRVSPKAGCRFVVGITLSTRRLHPLLFVATQPPGFSTRSRLAAPRRQVLHEYYPPPPTMLLSGEPPLQYQETYNFSRSNAD